MKIFPTGRWAETKLWIFTLLGATAVVAWVIWLEKL